MWAIYSKPVFDAIKATVEADSAFVSTTSDFHFRHDSVAALTVPASTAGVHLSYAAIDTNNVVKCIWSISS